MRNEILAEEILYPPQGWDKQEAGALTTAELIRSNKDLEQFAFAASHDLQEPLKVVSVYLQFFKRRYGGKLDGRADEIISSVLDRTERMQDLIQSLLNYSRAGQKNIQFTKVDSSILVNRAVENLEVNIEKHSAQVRWECCPVVMGDEIQLTQLFQNLVHNAIKFRKKEGHPSIYISSQEIDGQWRFSIQDNGIGIAAEHGHSIFELFSRLHAQSEYAGNGIGLALCKRIVEAHRGNIWVESEVGKGTTVYFTMPI